MPTYDAMRFSPPAPVALVTLRNRDTGLVLEDVPMLLDSGADGTLVPQEAITRLRLEPISEMNFRMTGFDGSAQFAQAVYLELLFLGRTFRGDYLPIDQEWGIIGRNILNFVPLFFDGPRLTWGEYQRG